MWCNSSYFRVSILIFFLWAHPNLDCYSETEAEDPEDDSPRHSFDQVSIFLMEHNCKNSGLFLTLKYSDAFYKVIWDFIIWGNERQL